MLVAAAIVAIVFGALTVFSGGAVLFGGGDVRQAAGNVVPFVLWFNFAAGFAYVIAGFALLVRMPAATWLSALILAATVCVSVAFAIHVATGGAYEMRTVGALALRTAVWLIITMIAARNLRRQ